MRYLAQAHVDFTASASARFFLTIHALANSAQTIVSESFHVTPESADIQHATGPRGENRLVVIATDVGLRADYEAVVECAPDLRPVSEVETWPPAPLDHLRAGYLFPSRYCESDQLGHLAWEKFGGIAAPHARAAAVRDWIHANITYQSGSTHAGTSACSTLVQRVGVCRDFAHLGVALCRALNLPARYATGYACDLQPPDMHAWFEVAIGEHWVAYDATGLSSPNGLVRVAHGRDAADTSIATAFGPAQAGAFAFSCVPADPSEKFLPVNHHDHVLVHPVAPLST